MPGLLRALFGRVRVSRDARGRTPLPLTEAAPADVTRLLRLDDEAATARNLSRGRLSVIGLVVGVGFAFMALRAIDLALFSEVAPIQRGTIVAAAQNRGEILDRNGEILATNLDFHTLQIDPASVWDAGDAGRQIASVLTDLDPDWIERRINSGNALPTIARGLTPAQRQAIHLLGIPGTVFTVTPGRVYPKRMTASHLVGFADPDLVGIAGAEMAFDAELSAGDGRPVSLSIDLTAQYTVEQVLRERMAEFRAEGASAILMRVGTGEIIAMASLPDFDPNRRNDFAQANLISRATSGVYELGSVLKPLTLAAALETGTVGLDDVFDARAPLRVGGFTINDFHPLRRPMTARESVIYSSNIATARIADRIGGEALSAFFNRLHLLDVSPIEVPERGRPIPPRRWGQAETMTAAYGHGFNISPVTLTAAFAALANGGVYVAPTLRPVAPGETLAGEPVMSARTAAQVLGVMRQVVTEGSGGNADVPGMAVAGKTGTAEQIVNGRYDPRTLITSFVSIFPFDDPQYVLLVTLYRPQATPQTHGYATAGWNAAPTSGEMIEQLASTLGITPREAAPGAQASTVAQMFAPTGRVRAGPEEPLSLDAARSRPVGQGEGRE